MVTLVAFGRFLKTVVAQCERERERVRIEETRCNCSVAAQTYRFAAHDWPTTQWRPSGRGDLRPRNGIDRRRFSHATVAVCHCARMPDSARWWHRSADDRCAASCTRSTAPRWRSGRCCCCCSVSSLTVGIYLIYLPSNGIFTELNLRSRAWVRPLAQDMRPVAIRPCSADRWPSDW